MNNKFNKSLTDKLDHLLTKKGINKAQLSRESGIPYTTIDGFYKRGMENIKLSTLLRLTDYFNIPIDYFIEQQEDFSPLLLNEVVSKLRENEVMLHYVSKYIGSLDERERALVERMIDHFALSPNQTIDATEERS